MTLDQLNELLSGSPDDLIAALKAGRPESKVTDYQSQFNVSGHLVNDTAKRPNKTVKTEDGDGKPITKTELVNRIGISLQEIICERAVSFLFGLPVKLQCEPVDTNQETLLNALSRVLKDNKIHSFNAEIALDLFRATEVAECWFVTDTGAEHEHYGFSTRFKLKVIPFSPWAGDELLPLFDATGDMIAFSRSYTVSESGKDVPYFETYTAEVIRQWRKGPDGWEELKNEKNAIGKIPVVYARQSEPEWAGVQSIIERLEKLLSNYADTTDYHASPTIVVQGQVQGFASKGEAGKILQLDPGADVNYLSWQQAPDMVKLEIETLFRLCYSLTQTPDISFEAIKGLGDISGVALRMLFLDAHLKVKKKQRIFDAYLERRCNILKAFLATLNTGLTDAAATIDIDSVIQPYMIDDRKSQIDELSSATGGKALMSQKTAVKLLGLSDDIDAEVQQIQAEETALRTIDITDPTV